MEAQRGSATSIISLPSASATAVTWRQHVASAGNPNIVLIYYFLQLLQKIPCGQHFEGGDCFWRVQFGWRVLQVFALVPSPVASREVTMDDGNVYYYPGVWLANAALPSVYRGTVVGCPPRAAEGQGDMHSTMSDLNESADPDLITEEDLARTPSLRG